MPPSTAPLLPAGRWTVDPAASTVGFRARGVFGLVPVTGTFGSAEGELDVDGTDAHGELRIPAASLDTRNAKRDEHLRSGDFFDVEHHPTVVFQLDGVVAGPDGPTLAGTLRIRDNALALRSPLVVATPDAETLRLSTAVDVDRAAAGVGWAKFGMIQGKARLSVEVTLRRAS
jgi:polyisoprenoid-binding protein YceI